MVNTIKIVDNLSQKGPSPLRMVGPLSVGVSMDYSRLGMKRSAGCFIAASALTAKSALPVFLGASGGFTLED